MLDNKQITQVLLRLVFSLVIGLSLVCFVKKILMLQEAKFQRHFGHKERQTAYSSERKKDNFHEESRFYDSLFRINLFLEWILTCISSHYIKKRREVICYTK